MLSSDCHWHVGPLADLIAPRPEHVNVEKLFAKCDAHGQPLVSTVQLEQIGDLQRTLQQISKILSELHVLPDYAKNPGTRLIQIQSLARQARHLLGTGLIEKDLRSIVEAQLMAPIKRGRSCRWFCRRRGCAASSSAAGTA